LAADSKKGILGIELLFLLHLVRPTAILKASQLLAVTTALVRSAQSSAPGKAPPSILSKPAVHEAQRSEDVDA